MKRLTLYLRRSSNEQDQSIEGQQEDCLKSARIREYQLVKPYIDDAITGTSVDDRAAFKQMVLDAQSAARPFDAIMAYDIKRFSRGDILEAAYYIHLLRQHGVEVIYASENFNGDDSDLLVWAVKQYQARQETKDLSRVTFRGLISRATDGWWNGGVPPYGYDREYVDSSGKAYQRVRFNADRSKLVSDLATGGTRLLPRGERPLVSKKDRCRLVLSTAERVSLAHRIADMYVNHEMGLRMVAETLNREEIPSPKGKRWTVGTIRSIIENPIYTGRMVYNRRASGKFHRIQSGIAVKRDDSEFEKFMRCSQDDWIVGENAHPAIIDDATFQRAQELLRERSRKHGAAAFRSGRAKESPYLLSGLIHCLRCGHKYHGRSTAKGKVRKDGTRGKTYYYACNSYINGKSAECPGAMFRRDPLDGGVLARVRQRVEAILGNGGRVGLRALIVEEMTAGKPDVDGETSRLKSSLGETERKIDNLLESLTPVNKQYVDKKIVVLEQEKDAFEARLKELESMKRQEVDCDAIADEIMAAVSGFDGLFEQGTIQERKEFIGLFVEKIELDPDKRAGKVYMKRLPMPTSGTKESFGMVAGAGFEPATFGL